MGREPDTRTLNAMTLFCELTRLGRLAQQTGISAESLASLPEQTVYDLCAVADAYARRENEQAEREAKKWS